MNQGPEDYDTTKFDQCIHGLMAALMAFVPCQKDTSCAFSKLSATNQTV